MNWKGFSRSGRWVRLLLVLAILFVANIIVSFVRLQWDLTEDKRFTISTNTAGIVAATDDNVSIRVLLDGEFPAGFVRLQTSVRDMLDKLRDINPNISYEFEDPSAGTVREKEERRKMLQEEKIIPVSLSYSDGTQVVQKAVYPFAILYYKQRKYVVNLLEDQKPGDDEEVVLNKSISLLEYKFANAFQKIQAPRPKNVLFLQGHGEWDASQTFRLESEIRKYHKVGRVNPDTLMRLDSTIDLILVCGPKTAMPLKDQFKIDQYLMSGGKIIWLVDKFDVSLDSINKHKFYVPPTYETGLDDMLFKYGVRLMPDLVVDLECSAIPQVVGMTGDKPQTRLFPWIYNLSVASDSEHPIAKNIDRVNLSFPGSIDTLKTNSAVKKTILLHSSRYSRTQLAPVRLTFEILKSAPDPAKFNDGYKPLAVLLEGEFESFFKNRITPEFQTILDQIGIRFIEKSRPAKQIVVSDSDFAKNLVNSSTGETEEIGYNKWERRFYKGNKEFILNAVEYMLDENNILTSRSKEVKLRLLDPVRTKQEKTFWQFLNVVLPVILLILFGLVYRFFRKRKYAY